MVRFSVVIICKNEKRIIADTLAGLVGITDDIIVYDNGSTDGTQEIIKQFPVQFFQGEWEGYGKTKHKANELAQYNWILSLDADEVPDEKMKGALRSFSELDEKAVYKLKFRTYIGEKCMRYGVWGGETHIRLFNRERVHWDDAEVHEKLVLPQNHSVKSLPGYIQHYTMDSFETYEKKMREYARLSAEKYHRMNKKLTGLKSLISPVYSFIKNYFFKLGILDGAAGFHSARIHALYTYLKYKGVKDLQKS